jgi:hypothetical protein
MISTTVNTSTISDLIAVHLSILLSLRDDFCIGFKKNSSLFVFSVM